MFQQELYVNFFENCYRILSQSSDQVNETTLKWAEKKLCNLQMYEIAIKMLQIVQLHNGLKLSYTQPHPYKPIMLLKHK